MALRENKEYMFVTPGTRIASVDTCDEIGIGTYTHEANIYASVAGFVHRTTVDTNANTDAHAVGVDVNSKEKTNTSRGKDKQKNKEVVQVMQSTGRRDDLLVPGEGSVVTCRVLKVSPFQARVAMLCVDGKALRSDFPGVIRTQDVRQTEIDKVVMGDCFRPGDIVQAQVISLGDQRNYYLTTAKNEYGVIYAKSTSGGVMVPVNWQTMQCMTTRMREPRKVAHVA